MERDATFDVHKGDLIGLQVNVQVAWRLSEVRGERMKKMERYLYL